MYVSKHIYVKSSLQSRSTSSFGSPSKPPNALGVLYASLRPFHLAQDHNPRFSSFMVHTDMNSGQTPGGCMPWVHLVGAGVVKVWHGRGCMSWTPVVDGCRVCVSWAGVVGVCRGWVYPSYVLACVLNADRNLSSLVSGYIHIRAHYRQEKTHLKNNTKTITNFS